MDNLKLEIHKADRPFSPDELLNKLLPNHEPCSYIVRKAFSFLYFNSGVPQEHEQVAVQTTLSRTACLICAVLSKLVLRNTMFNDSWRSLFLHTHFVSYTNREGSNSVGFDLHLIGLDERAHFQLGFLSLNQTWNKGEYRWNPRDLWLHLLHLLEALSSTQYVHSGVGFGYTSQLNIEKVQDWLHGCCSIHTKCNENFLGARSIRNSNLMLIDVLEKKLVNSGGDDAYVALSYVSGGTPDARTLMSNLESLTHPGALGRPEFQLPTLFMGAISLVQSLGLKYLWIE